MASKHNLKKKTSAWINRLGDANLVRTGSSLKVFRVADIHPGLAPSGERDTAVARAVAKGASDFVSELDGIFLCYGKPSMLNQYFVAYPLPMAALVS